MPELTPEQLVEQLRYIADGFQRDFAATAKTLDQAADLIESHSAELKDAKLEWGVSSRNSNGELFGFVGMESHAQAVEKLLHMQEGVTERTYFVTTMAEWEAENYRLDSESQSKQLDVAARDYTAEPARCEGCKHLRSERLVNSTERHYYCRHNPSCGVFVGRQLRTAQRLAMCFIGGWRKVAEEAAKP